MTYPDAVQATVDNFGQITGMRKHSGAWYGSSRDVWTVVQLQKSQYGRSYFLNVGFWLKAPGDTQPPKERDFHIRARLNALLPDLDTQITELLDLETSLSDAERKQRLTSILRDSLWPLLRRGSTIDGLQAMHRERLFRASGLRGEALAVLNAYPAGEQQRG